VAVDLAKHLTTLPAPDWGFNGLGEIVYLRTYSRFLEAEGRSETWPETVERVVRGAVAINSRLTDAEQIKLAEHIHQLRGSVSGRALWQLGTSMVERFGQDSLLNCLAGETEVLTGSGIRPIAELTGGTHRLLTEGGRWVDAPVRSFGRQALHAITLRRAGVRKIIRATAGHRWFTVGVSGTRTERTTLELLAGDRLVSVREAHRAVAVAPAFAFAETTTAATKASVPSDWEVVSIRPTGEVEEVFCAVVAGTRSFALADELLTGNCYFTNIATPDDIVWLMGRLMVGGGVGFSIESEVIHDFPKVKGAQVTHMATNDADFIVPDSRAGWGELMKRLFTAAFEGKDFTYSTVLIRPMGAPLKTFGGTASGSTALIAGIEDIMGVLNARAGNKLRPIDVLDICNILGRVVVAGSARRSAQIAIGDVDDLKFLRAKRWSEGNIPAWRANSNNTLVANEFADIPAQFWANFDGNSEPYGLFNRKLTRTVGRLGERKSDPSVVGANPCFSGDTRFLTSEGWRTFTESVGASPQIVQDARIQGALRGEREVWSVDMTQAGTTINLASNVRITARAKQLYRLTSADGRVVRATADHHFATPEGMVELKDLKVGDQLLVALPEAYRPNRAALSYTEGYLIGLVASDGHISNGQAAIRIWGNLSRLDAEVTRISSMLHKVIDAAVADDPTLVASGGTRPIATRPAWTAGTPSEGGIASRVCSSTVLGRYITARGWEKEDLSWLHYTDRDFKAGFVSGFAYGDGSVQDANGSLSLRISQSSRDRLATLQLVLQELGIRASLLRRHDGGARLMPDGKGGRRHFETQPLYELIISGRAQGERYAEAIEIPPHAHSRFVELMDRYSRSAYRSKELTTVASIEIDSVEDVYCLQEDRRRTLVANGLTARRCAEIGLAHREACNLATIFLPKVRSKDELIELSKLLYKVQKATALLPHPDAETNEIVHKNMRLGQSLTGILQATDEQRSWVSDAYEALVAFDEEWSKTLGVKPSIRLTAVQPSGTLSLLPGVTPGIHGAYSPYYIRRVRFGATDPLVEVCRAKGYPVTYDVGLDGREDRSRFVVEFPAMAPAGTKIASAMSAIEQLEEVTWAQEHWADNMVSVTVTYRDEELPAIKAWLVENYDRKVKSVSFLRYSDHGFALAPYEPIDEAEYNRRLAAVKGSESPIALAGVSTLDEADCVGGACPVR
jgi:hypothetical protein